MFASKGDDVLRAIADTLPDFVARGVMDFLPSGYRVATTSMHQLTAALWRADSMQPLHTFGYPQQDVLGVKFFPRGDMMLTIGTGSTISIWDAASGALLRLLEVPGGEVLDVEVFPFGSKVVTCSRGSTAIIWDADTGAKLMVLDQHEGDILDIEVFPRGDRVATVSRDRTAIIWDVATGEAVRTLKGHNDEVQIAKVHPSGEMLVTCSRNMGVVLWNVSTGEVLGTFEHESHAVQNSLAFGLALSEDGNRMATFSGNYHSVSLGPLNGVGFHMTIFIWDLATRVRRHRFALSGDPVAVKFLSGGRLLAVVTQRSIFVVDALTGERRWSIDATASSPIVGEIRGVAASSEGDLFVTCSLDEAIVWDAETGRALRSLMPPPAPQGALRRSRRRAAVRGGVVGNRHERNGCAAVGPDPDGVAGLDSGYSAWVEASVGRTFGSMLQGLTGAQAAEDGQALAAAVAAIPAQIQELERRRPLQRSASSMLWAGPAAVSKRRRVS